MPAAGFRQVSIEDLLPVGWRSATGIRPLGRRWLADALYFDRKKRREGLRTNWLIPEQSTPLVAQREPVPEHYFQLAAFVWAPLTMWRITLECPRCTP